MGCDVWLADEVRLVEEVWLTGDVWLADEVWLRSTGEVEKRSENWQSAKQSRAVSGDGVRRPDVNAHFSVNFPITAFIFDVGRNAIVRRLLVSINRRAGHALKGKMLELLWQRE